ncbi:MAG: ECF-type sigma factor [Planctomycetota bacterium]
MTDHESQLTQLLQDVRSGGIEARGKLFDQVYGELRAVASRAMMQERADHTLTPTALVHEAYCRLAGTDDEWDENRAFFFQAYTTAMRRVLVDYARRRNALKRGGGCEREPLSTVVAPANEGVEDVDLVALDAALNQLTERDPTAAQVVEMRYFGGLTFEETAASLGISPSAAKRDWAFAKMWLQKAMQG